MFNDQMMRCAYNAYWQTTPDIAFIKDLNGVYQSVSKSFIEMTGWQTETDLIGKTDFEVFADEELAKRYTDDDAHLLANGVSIVNYVEPIPPKDGRPRYGLTSKHILRDNDNNPIGIYGVGRDITAEYEARQIYENELKNLFELPPDAPVAVLFDITAWRVVDVRYRDEKDRVVSSYRQIDEYVENVVNSIVDDEAARSFFQRFSPEFLMAEYREGKNRHTLEYLREMNDGEKRWVRDELHFLLDPVNGHLSLIVVLHDIDASRRAYEKLVLAAERDAMTGLLNHSATINCIQQYLVGASGLQAIFMIDLDNFKQINDSFGHVYGDTILTKVGSAISDVFRTTDIIGRIGGDEFMVLMKDVVSEETVRRKADALLSALQFSASGGDVALELTTSVGISLFTADDIDFNALYGQVDAALYRSKGQGKNRYTLLGQGDTYEQQADDIPVFESVNTVQLRTLLDNMDGGVVMAEVRDDVRVTYISPSLFRSFGRVPDPSVDNTQAIFAYVLPTDLPGLRAALFEAAESNALIEYTYRVSYDDYTEWRCIRAKRIPETGDGIQRLVAVITNVSDLQNANEHLREAEARYRIAMEQTEAMLWEVDILTRTLKRTGTAWSRFGSDLTVFPDAPESYILANRIHENSIPQLRRMFQNLYAGDDSGIYYFKIYSADREEVWVKDRFKLLRYSDGTPYCALGISQLVPNINAEMQTFENELRFADIVRSTLMGYVRANFTQNRLEIARMDNDTRYARFSDMPYAAFYDAVCNEFVDEEDLLQFRSLISRESLLKRFHEGESWKFIDYRRIDSDGVHRWTSLFIRLMRHPISSDVYAFSYLRDNETARRWELELRQPITRSATLLLYSQSTMEAMAKHILSTCPDNRVVAVSVIEIAGLDRVRTRLGELEERELLYTFGRLCRIVISGEVIGGQLSENRISLLRVDAGGAEVQRERISATMALLKKLLRQAHPQADVLLIGGFAVERADRTTYGQLLRRADIACKSAAQTLSESAVSYVDTGLLPPDEGNNSDLAERYRALALRYQQQANMLRVSENDELTGILGKSAFYRRVRELLDTESSRKFAIVRFDINRFKVYNDVRGTIAGDKLLCDIAAKIRDACGSAVLYARLESDHFVLLVPDDEMAIRRSVKQLADWLAQCGSDFRLSATVGVYRIDTPSIDVSLMCDRALLALRSVKTGFDTKLAYYNYTLRYRLIDEQQLVSDMEDALKTGQFGLFFQPQVNYETGQLVGAEALVRWNHPTRGLLPPSVFIPLFEKNGLITHLDEYVWDRCCQYVKQWHTQYPQAQALSLSISVNVSRLDIYDTKLCEVLRNLTDKYGLPPSTLRLEITESAYMENPQQLIDTVGELHEAGFIVEMDDFGSGYSSLNTLKDVSVDVLKLDMKFLADCADSSRGGNILSSVIRMAHWLKLPIIAEGVETKVQADYLKSLGCVYMQGYFFARPMPASGFEALLTQGAVSFSDRYQSANIAGMAAFWDPSAQTALLFNSFIGGAAVMEYRGGVLEVLRVNDNYYKTLGTTREAYLPVQTNLLNRFNETNQKLLLATIEKAMATGEESECELESLSSTGGVTNTWMRNRIRLLARNIDSAILYVAIENVSERKRMEREQIAESERTRLLMQTTGLALFDYDLKSDTVSYRAYQPGQGITERIIENYYKYLLSSQIVTPESAAAIRGAIEDVPGVSSSGMFEFRANLWNTGMRWCRLRYVGVDDGSGHIYRWVGQVDDIQDIKDRLSISKSIRQRLNSDTPSYTFNEDVVEQIFDLFYNTPDIASAIETTLSLLGEYYDISRVYILEDTNEHTSVNNTFEWCAPGVASMLDTVQNIAYDDIGGREEYISLFDESGVWYCPDVRALIPGVRTLLETQGIRSMLQYAIRDSGVFTGIIGFDECRENRRWTDEQTGTLMFISRIIVSHLLRLRQSDSSAFSVDFRAALDDNAEYIYIIDPDTYEIIYTNKAVQQYSGRNFVGDICYKEFIGRDTPCPQCPVRNTEVTGKLRLAEVTRADGMVLLSHASPLRWNGRDIMMLSCVDVTDRTPQKRAKKAKRK